MSSVALLLSPGGAGDTSNVSAGAAPGDNASLPLFNYDEFGESTAVAAATFNDTFADVEYYYCMRFKFAMNTVIISALCVFGLVGNTLSVFILQRDQHNRVAVFLLQSLAFADNSVLCTAFLVLSVVYGLLPVTGRIDVVHAATPYLIKFVNPVGFAVQSCGVWITVLLAINRYIAVCRPFCHPRWLSLKFARIEVAVVVLVSFVLNAPRIFQYDIGPPPNNNDTHRQETSTTTNYHMTALGDNFFFAVIYLNVFYTSVVLILPMIVLVALNIMLIRRLQKSKRKMQHSSLHYSGASENSITAVMIAVILELIICHTPDRIAQIINVTVGKKNDCPSAMFYLLNFSNLSIIIASSTNFIIYFVMRRSFRRTLGDRLCFLCGSHRGGRHSTSWSMQSADLLDFRNNGSVAVNGRRQHGSLGLCVGGGGAPRGRTRRSEGGAGPLLLQSSPVVPIKNHRTSSI